MNPKNRNNQLLTWKPAYTAPSFLFSSQQPRLIRVIATNRNPCYCVVFRPNYSPSNMLTAYFLLVFSPTLTSVQTYVSLVMTIDEVTQSSYSKLVETAIEWIKIMGKFFRLHQRSTGIHNFPDLFNWAQIFEGFAIIAWISSMVKVEPLFPNFLVPIFSPRLTCLLPLERSDRGGHEFFFFTSFPHPLHRNSPQSDLTPTGYARLAGARPLVSSSLSLSAH